MLELSSVLELQPLEEVSPQFSCESLGHVSDSVRHAHGPGKFYIKVLHDCNLRPEGQVYLACEKFGDWINSRQDLRIACTDCNYRGLVKDWACVVSEI